MNNMKEIIENSAIDSWIKRFSRSPRQKNVPHESDAELIEVPQYPEHYVAVTIDTIAEEISSGIYRDPRTMGWITVVASLSDLTAVGADPIGVVISVSVKPGQDDTFTGEIAQGIEDACRKHHAFILGGDTNESAVISLTGCAVGLVPRGKEMKRAGCRPGDVIFVTGPVGMGNALGLARLLQLPEEVFPEKLYRPVAQIAESRIIRNYASSCMDTSDGLLITLDQLMRINGMGFSIERNFRDILSPEVITFCDRAKTPYWIMCAGIHGEFKLVFTVPADKTDSLLKDYKSIGTEPIRIGVVRETPDLSVLNNLNQSIAIDMTPLRNLMRTISRENAGAIINEFRTFGSNAKLE